MHWICTHLWAQTLRETEALRPSTPWESGGQWAPAHHTVWQAQRPRTICPNSFPGEDGEPSPGWQSPGGTGRTGTPVKGAQGPPPDLSQGPLSPQEQEGEPGECPGQAGGEAPSASPPAPPAAHFFCLTGGVSAGKLSPAVCKHLFPLCCAPAKCRRQLGSQASHKLPSLARAPRGLPQSRPGGLSPSALRLEAS